MVRRRCGGAFLLFEATTTAAANHHPRSDPVADGAGDTVLPWVATRASYFSTALHVGRLVPHLTEKLAIIRRRHTRPSPAITEFTAQLTAHFVKELN